MSHNIHMKPVGQASYAYSDIDTETTNISRPVSPSASLHQRSPSPPISSPESQSRVSVRESDLENVAPKTSILISSEDGGEKRFKTITSQWKVEWRTSALLIVSYLVALIAAIGHLIWFLRLNGTHTEEYFIPQGYVTTISNLIATIWGLCLSACLSVVFTQGFWNILRKRYTPVGQIENLYGLLGNVFLFRPGLMLTMPLLYAVAIFAWSLSILKTLLPGSLTVGYAPFSNSSDVTIPAFNSSDVGSGLFQDVMLKFPAYTTISYTSDQNNRYIPHLSFNEPTGINALKRAMSRYFSDGELPVHASPCGVNCSFVFEMEAPRFECKTSGYNASINSLNSLGAVDNMAEYDFYRGSFNMSAMRIEIIEPLGVPVSPRNDSEGNYTVATDETLAYVNDTVCQYATAIYTVNVSYVNNVPSIVYSTSPLGLSEFSGACSDQNRTSPWCSLNGVGDVSNAQYGSLNWTLDNTSMNDVRALKTFALTEYMLDVLNGTMTSSCSLPLTPTNGMNPLSCTLSDTAAPIIDTLFYNATADLVATPSYTIGDAIPRFQTSPDILEAALFNVTMTYLYSIDNFQNQTISATQNWQLLTYVFSRRLNLILPYFISLGLAIPALIYALVLLYHTHHVAAMGDSFIQILMTTTGSPTLTELAVGGCLGGDNNVPKELKELKIKYGDITRSEGGIEPTVRHAGFGVEGEVTNLRRRAVYGSSIAM